MRRYLPAAALLLPAILLSSALDAQSTADVPAEVLVLGTYHFANPGLDVVKTEVADVLAPDKQAEIRDIVEALARFRPTRIAVEHPPENASRLDSLYQAYRAGRHTLERDETEQLGFRLARMLEHARVYPIDHRGEFPFGAVMQYAQQNDPAFLGRVQKELGRVTEEMNRRQREHTIGEILRMLNSEEELAMGHGWYLRIASVGAGDGYVGADLLSKWYDRNIRIFANLQRVAEPGERVLVIIGSGHAPIIRQLVSGDPELKLATTSEYLPAGGIR